MWDPKNPAGQMQVSHWFGEEKGPGRAVWNLPSSSLPPLLLPIKEFQAWECLGQESFWINQPSQVSEARRSRGRKTRMLRQVCGASGERNGEISRDRELGDSWCEEQIWRAASPPAASPHLLWMNFQGESQRPASCTSRLCAWTVTLLLSSQHKDRHLIPHSQQQLMLVSPLSRGLGPAPLDHSE